MLPLRELDAEARAAWHSLADRAAEPNPFFEAGFTLAAASCLEVEGVDLLVAADGGEWRGCLPVRSLGHWRRLPGRWLVAWRHLYSFLGTPLLEAGSEAPALEAMLDAADRGGPRILLLDWLGMEGPVARAATEVAAVRGGGAQVYGSFERATIERREEATYLDQMSKSRRKELRRLGRRLAEEVGGELTTVDHAGDPTAVDRFLALEQSGWKGRQATAMASQPGHARLLHELWADFASRGRAELLSLEGGDRVLAMQCNLAAGDCAFSFKVAHDEAYGRYSPGVQLELFAIEAFHANAELARMDSCADPDNELINRMWPDRRRLASMALPLGPPRARPALRTVLRAHRRLVRDGR